MNDCKGCLHFEACEDHPYTCEAPDAWYLFWGKDCPVYKDRTKYAEVVHGRWVVGGDCHHVPYRIKNREKWVTYKCSVCGYSNGRNQSNHCPNCGAKMDGGVDT